MFCRLDTRNKTLPSICIIKQFWEIVPCLPYSNNLFFFLLFYVLKIILENSSTFSMRNVDSTGWDRSMLIIVIEIIFIMNKFLLVSRRARWFIFRNIHCKRNVSVLYQVSATTSKKCFKQNTQVESETWKPKKRNSYKRLISFALTLSTFFVCSIHEFLQTNLWMGAFLTNTIDWWIYFSDEHHFVFDDSQ